MENSKKLTIYVDIDETICITPNHYSESKPIFKMIEKINKLYDDGNLIVYWTSEVVNQKKIIQNHDTVKFMEM